MKINSIILCGIMLTACNCVSKIENIAAGTDGSTSDFSNSTSTDTDTGIFTSTEYSNSTEISSESDSSSTTTFISDLNFVESSSSSSGDFTTGEIVAKCNNSETGECKVFVTSMSTFPNIGIEGFDKFCTEIECGSNFVCDPYQALIRKNGNFWGPFENFNGQYVLPSGKVIASGTDSLQFASSINENEAGVVIPNKTSVWTGFDSLFFTCFSNNVSWETNDPQRFGDIGYVGGVNETWYTGEQISCNSTAHVICVEKVKE